MWTSIRYILLCALRDRLFLGLAVGVAVAAMIAAMLGGTAMVEEKEMTLSFAGASSRLMLAVGLIVFVCFHIRNAYDSREIDVMLSRPVSRAQLVIAFWLGFALVGALLVVPLAAALAVIGPLYWDAFFIWCASLLAEGAFVVALALFAAMTMRSGVASVMACLGFYALSRMMAFFVLAAVNHPVDAWWYAISAKAVEWISVVIPRLDFFGRTEWLVYGTKSAQDWQLFTLQAAVFIPILLVASILDFRRKQF